MPTKFISFLFLIICFQLLTAVFHRVQAQHSAQKIGNNPTVKDASAVLEVESTNKGFLPPRLTTAQRNAITLPATGLVLFNVTLSQLQVNTGTPAAPVWTNATIGVLPVANGGTGAATLPAYNLMVGNGTSPVATIAPGASGQVLTSNGTSWVSAPSTANALTASNGLTRATNDITLGGTLTANTNIAGNFNLSTTGTGRFGIGTTAPTEKLHVEGNVLASQYNFKGVGGNSGIAANNYGIYQETGAWTTPFPDLNISYLTGIKMYGHYAYDGIRFYTGNTINTNLAFQVGTTSDWVVSYKPLLTSGGFIYPANFDASGYPIQSTYYLRGHNDGIGTNNDFRVGRWLYAQYLNTTQGVEALSSYTVSSFPIRTTDNYIRMFSAADMRTALGLGAKPTFTGTGATAIALSSTSSSNAALELTSPVNATSTVHISFHRPNQFASNFGLDADNAFAFGGWSHGNGYAPIKTGNITSSGSVTTSANVIVGGNVGIGTTTPAATLDVNGSIRVKVTTLSTPNTTYNITAADSYININAANVTVVLPPPYEPSNAGRIIYISRHWNMAGAYVSGYIYSDTDPSASGFAFNKLGMRTFICNGTFWYMNP